MRFDASKRILVIALDDCLNPTITATKSKATNVPAVTYRQAILARDSQLTVSIQSQSQLHRLFLYCKFCYDRRMEQQRLASTDDDDAIPYAFLFLFRWLMKINEKIYLLIRVFDDMMIGGEYLLFITATMF